METSFAFALILGLVTFAELLVIFFKLRAVDARSKTRADETLREIGRMLDAMGAMRSDFALTRALTTSTPFSMQPRSAALDQPIDLAKMTEVERDRGLTLEMMRPVGLPARAISVNVGAEIVELDADIVARLEALTDDVNAGRAAGTLLAQAIQAGLGQAKEQARDSGNMPVERESDEQTWIIDPSERPARPVDSESEPPKRRANLYPLFRPAVVADVPAPLPPRKR